MAYALEQSEGFAARPVARGALLEPRMADPRREAAAAADGDDVSDELGLFPRRISKTEIIYATNQLAIMVETGVTLSAALEGIVKDEQNPTLRYVLNDLRKTVEGGEDFSTALAKHPRYFNKTYLSLIKAGEATGTLAEMLDRIAQYLRKEVETRGKVRAAMAYPTVMMVLAIKVTIFLLTYILPKFTPLFTRKGIKLPKPTVFMMTISSVLIDYWYFWLAGAAALVIGFVIGKRTTQGRLIWDGVKIHLPIIGPVLRKVIISRSIRTLGTLVGSGVSMLDAIRLSAEVAGNVHYEKLWYSVLDQITSGNQIHAALAGSPLFPPVLVQMIRSGEETGKLDVVLARVSDYYDQEVDASLKTCTSLIEPIMITMMGVVVGGIGLALLLPIFSLSRHVG
jgi:type IV pilus assembly protein PilC